MILGFVMFWIFAFYFLTTGITQKEILDEIVNPKYLINCTVTNITLKRRHSRIFRFVYQITIIDTSLPKEQSTHQFEKEYCPFPLHSLPVSAKVYANAGSFVFEKSIVLEHRISNFHVIAGIICFFIPIGIAVL